MPSEPELTQRSQHQIVAELRNAAALLYPEESSARVIVDDAGLDARQIAFSSRAESNWHNIWLTAIRQNQVEALVAVLADRYPSNLPLQAAIANYQHFLAAGGQFNAQTLLADSSTEDDVAPAPGESPYQGMAYYDVDDADRFFGREALTAELVEYLRQQPLLAVVGASGSGKSSLVRAGVMPALQGKTPLVDGKQPPAGSARWAYHLITPTARPLESLAASLTRSSESVTATSTLIDDLGRDARSLHLYARRLVSGEQRLLLLVDQFEELFTLCKNETEQGAFVDNLLYAAQPDNDPKNRVVTLVLTLRADFYHHCARFPALRTALENQQKYIGAMTPDELRRAIEEPAKAGQWDFQAGLVEQLLQDVGNEPGALPLLSHALLETWQRRRGRMLTLASYRTAGGVQGAIAKTADEVFSRFTEEQKTIARIIFLRLTELGEGVQDTRRRLRRDELKLTHASDDEVHDVLGKLIKARLVTTGIDEIQVAHEALIRNWETLREWLDDDREGNRIQRRLTEAVNQWVEFDKDANLLYRGVLLQQAQEWLQNTIELPNQHEMEFLRLSQQANEKARRLRRFVTQVLVSLTFVALLAASIAWMQTLRVTTANEQLDGKNKELGQTNIKLSDTITQLNRTVDGLDAAKGQLQQIVSETQRLANIAFSRQLAAQSTSELSKEQYELAILLAIESGHITDTFESFSAIRSAIANPWHSRVVFYVHNTNNVTAQASWSQDESKILTTGGGNNTVRIWDAVTSQELLKLKGHMDLVTQASWNKDENKVLTTSEDDTARIWDATTGQELLKLEGHTNNITKASWNQDESKVLTTSEDDTVRIWDATTGQELLKLEGVRQASWSQDESKILTTGGGSTARIWDAATGQELLKIEDHAQAFIGHASWNQDESKILTTGGDLFGNSNMTRIWDATTGQELLRLEGRTGFVYQVSWNQDESKILASSRDGMARIWDTDTGQELFRLEGHAGPITQAIWNQDESKILTTSYDGTVRVWNAATGQELLRLQGHTGFVAQAIWNQDESKILTRAHDVYLWDATTGQELLKFEGHTNDIVQAGWNQDESKIITGSRDGTIRIWDVAANQELLRLEGAWQASWSQDESKILTTGSYFLDNSNTARMWDAITGQELLKLEGHTDAVTQAGWNQDESKILTISWDDTIRIWDAATGQELLKFEGVGRASWSQDGSKILTTSGDGTVRIWDAATGQELLKLEGHTNAVTQAGWNQDGSKILTTSGDDTARIWDAVTGRELLRLERVRYASWSQDRSKILITSYDGTARIWDAATGQELPKLEGHMDYGHDWSWSQDGSKILTPNYDGTASIWNAATGQEVLKLEGHTAPVRQAIWNQDESKILTCSDDGTARIWEAITGRELERLEGHTAAVKQAVWSKDERKILTSSDDETVRIWYTQMPDLLVAGCKWVPRNFTWAEWAIYMEEVQGAYRPTCPNAPIPPDAIAGVQEKARQRIRNGQVVSGTQQLEKLNGWLEINGQFKNYGVDVTAFVSEVSATATAEALPMPIMIPTPSVTPSAKQPASPLLSQPTSLLSSPLVTPPATGTPVASSPVATPGR